MPWECQACRNQVADDAGQCPACQAEKTSWTMVPEQTRTFVPVRRGKVELLVARPTDDGHEPATRAIAVTRDHLDALAAAGSTPAPADLLVVRLEAGKGQSLDLSITPLLETEAVEAQDLPYDGPPADGRVVDRRVCFWRGPREPALAARFDGIDLCDVTDGDPGQHAPSVRVKALGKTQELPVEPRVAGITPRLVHDTTGAPLPFLYVTLGRDQDGRVVPIARFVTDSAGRLGLPREVGWQTRPPVALALRPAGEVVRLHWAYGFESDEELAALPARAWCEVTIGEEVRLRPSRARGDVRVRVLQPGDPPFPLAEAPCRLHGPPRLGLAPIDVRTDGSGLLAQEHLVHGLWRLETPSGDARVEPGPPTDEPIEVVVVRARPGVPSSRARVSAVPGAARVEGPADGITADEDDEELDDDEEDDGLTDDADLVGVEQDGERGSDSVSMGGGP